MSKVAAAPLACLTIPLSLAHTNARAHASTHTHMCHTWTKYAQPSSAMQGPMHKDERKLCCEGVPAHKGSTQLWRCGQTPCRHFDACAFGPCKIKGSKGTRIPACTGLSHTPALSTRAVRARLYQLKLHPCVQHIHTHAHRHTLTLSCSESVSASSRFASSCSALARTASSSWPKSAAATCARSTSQHLKHERVARREWPRHPPHMYSLCVYAHEHKHTVMHVH